MKKNSFVIIFLLILIPMTSAQFIQAYQQQRHQHQQRQGQAKYFSLKGKVIDWETNYVKKALVLIPEIGKSVETDE